jgi:hypothetical protein
VERKETERDREKRKIRQLAASSSYPEQLASFACFHGPTLHPPSSPPPAANSLLFFVLLQGTPDSSKHWPFVFSIVRFACTLVLLLFVDFVGPFFHLLL